MSGQMRSTMQSSPTIREEVVDDLSSRNPRLDIYQCIRDNSGDRYEDYVLTKKIAEGVGRSNNNVLQYLNEMEEMGYLEHDVIPRENAMDAKAWRFSPKERRTLLGEEVFTEKFHRFSLFGLPAIGGVLFGVVVMALSALLSVDPTFEIGRTVLTISATVLGAVLYVSYTESSEFDLLGGESE